MAMEKENNQTCDSLAPQCSESNRVFEKIKNGKIVTYKYSSKKARSYAKHLRRRLKVRRINEERPEDFKFHGKWQDSEDTIIHNVKIPDEIMVLILLCVPPFYLLNCSLVCKRWCNIVKSGYLWRQVYNRLYHPDRGRNLPWYVYYNYFTTNNYTNMITPFIKEEFNNSWGLGGAWEIPDDMDDSILRVDQDGNPIIDCCIWKNMRICLGKKRLLQYIIRRYRPIIYASEIVARGLERRPDYCRGNEYELWLEGFKETVRYFTFYGGNPVFCFKGIGGKCLKPLCNTRYTEKAELFVQNYCPRVKHLCMVRKFYSIGGVKCRQIEPVVKILFDSITKKKRRSREKRSINWLGLGWLNL